MHHMLGEQVKPGLFDHPKLLALQRRMRRPRYAVVGLLEALWHFTAEYAPQGDIGRFTDDEIARGVGYTKPGPRLVASLIDTGWLLVDSQFRLVVDRWPELADADVRKALRRKGLSFVQPSGAPASESAHQKDGTQPALKKLLRTKEGTKNGSDAPFLFESEANPHYPERKGSAEGKGRFAKSSPPGFGRFWAIYPNKKRKQKALAAWTKYRCEARTDLIIAKVEQLKAEDNHWLRGFIPHPTTWLNGGGWDDEPIRNPDADSKWRVTAHCPHCRQRYFEDEGHQCAVAH